MLSGAFLPFAPSRETLFSYSYLPNTDLISGYTAGDFTRTVAYEPYHSLITSVENKYGTTTISRYDYENDVLGRRTAIARSGVAFGDTPVRDAYGYNHRSEVTSARRTLTTNPSQELRGFSYDYAYDPIGNRIFSTEYDPDNNPLVSSYTANALNQYEQRTIPGYAAVRGSATNTATVTVNGNPTWRLDDYFYGGDAADNSAAAVMKELEIVAAYSNNYSAVTGNVFVAKTPEQYQYDSDGNLTQDGRFTYTWDAENRLISVTTRDDLPASVPRVRATHRYDHQSRRIATASSVWTNSIWSAAESRTFTYDGWNVINEVLSPESGVLSTNLYVWGLDISGTLQGAGGIGGLLSASFDNTTALYTYDANGNIGQLVDAHGAITAHYEYDPFGKTIISSGLLAKANPFRFSTKHWNNATGLGYWGYRWYNPDMGRWLSRDPIFDIIESLIHSDPHSAHSAAQMWVLHADDKNDLMFSQNSTLDYWDPHGLTCQSRRFKVHVNLPTPTHGSFQFVGKLEMAREVKTCDILCDNCSKGTTTDIKTFGRGTFMAQFKFPIGAPVSPWSVKVYGGGSLVGETGEKNNTCTGESSAYGCFTIEARFGAAGCIGWNPERQPVYILPGEPGWETPHKPRKPKWRAEACLHAEGFLKRQWCMDGSSQTCAGGRGFIETCFIWRCYRWVFFETEPRCW